MRSKSHTTGLRGYGVALLAVVLALLASHATWPISRSTPWVFSFAAVILTAWYGGQRSSLIATAGLTVLGRYYFMTPYHSLRLERDDLVLLLLFIGVSIIIGQLVAARRRAEDHERAERRRFQATVTSIGDAVIATDAQGRVSFMNGVAEELTGWQLAEAKGSPLEGVFAIVNGDSKLPIPNPVMKVMETGEVQELADHTLLLSREGIERPIQDSASPIRDADGDIIGAVLIFRDDTERRAYERRLIEDSRRKDEFLAMLAHELRNPLAAIKSAVNLLGTPEAADHHAWGREVLNRQVGNLTYLLDDLLDVARIARGRVVLRKESIDLAETIDNAVASVGYLLEERDHRAEVVIAEGVDRLEADPVRLEQILVNLISNAARYTPSGGLIRISADREGERIALRVEDNGSGIPIGRLATIFEPFTQGERTLDRAEGGLGIGLTIVKHLAELHGGTVTATSPGPGLGSVFTLRLPASEPARPASERPVVTPLPPAPTPVRITRILIIDDNKDLARSLARLLKLMGHEVKLAHDGPEGIEAALAYEPDVLLLDIGLPNLNGYEVARQLRLSENLKRSLFIAISGYALEEDRQRSSAVGIDHHLAKPVDIGTIASLIGQPTGAA
ncbi:ATP-binding protein [Tundrisphaera lichenicola]|uniref:ATP-binding response regulator n=1 Tax=Tundrisphaera lichenicola TaxID=2029860 RepID=UPI003EB8158A